MSSQHENNVDLTAIGRRELLLWGAGGIATLFVGANALALPVYPATVEPVVSTPALEEGPYWVDETLKAFHRVDMRANTDGSHVQLGVPLHLNLNINQVGTKGVVPLKDAYVYLWHCNAAGVYSDEPAQNSQGTTFLRGYQVSDKAGKVGFVTVYPGWYGGRTTHIHARIRLYPNGDSTKKPTYDFETQFFFDDALTDQISAGVTPYTDRDRQRDTSNDNDHVYTGRSLDGNGVSSNAGQKTMLKLTSERTLIKASLDVVMNLGLKEPGGGFGGGPGSPGGRGPGGPGGFGGPGGPGGPPPDGDFGGPGGPPPPPDGGGPPPRPDGGQ